MKSLPRNLLSVLDLVGDSTTTRFLPLALSPRLASIAASSTSGSGALGEALANRPRRFGVGSAGAIAPAGEASAFAGTALPADLARPVAFGLAAGFFFGFTSAVSPAAPSVRDFLVAMRIVSGGRAVGQLERDARRHLASA